MNHPTWATVGVRHTGVREAEEQGPADASAGGSSRIRAQPLQLEQGVALALREQQHLAAREEQHGIHRPQVLVAAADSTGRGLGCRKEVLR